MIVHISAEAERDMEAIGDYIARDDPARALSFVQELRKKCLELADLPEAFPLVPRYESHGIRRRAYGNYLIFYQVKAGSLFVLHGRRDYEPILCLP